jgi:hypothetical protein
MHPSSQRRLRVVECLSATNRLPTRTPGFTRDLALQLTGDHG